jgi:hypothetical protein
LIKTTCFFLLFCPAGKPEGMDWNQHPNPLLVAMLRGKEMWPWNQNKLFGLAMESKEIEGVPI